MPGLLEQLESNEAILLMFLAGELPAEDHAEVERRLTRDPALRAACDALRQAEDRISAAFSSAGDDFSTSHVDLAVSRTVRAMNRRRLELLARPAREAEEPRGKPRRWTGYAALFAAVLFLGFMIWWGNQDFNGGVSHAPLAIGVPADTTSASKVDFDQLAASFGKAPADSEDTGSDLPTNEPLTMTQPLSNANFGFPNPQ